MTDEPGVERSAVGMINPQSQTVPQVGEPMPLFPEQRKDQNWFYRHSLSIVLAVLLGLLAGIGAYTFLYAEGLSYMSDDPKVCVNCHIMQPQYDSWQKASHHTVATCVTCHLPHDFIGKYYSKAENGYHHSKAFTLQNFHEPITITEKASR